jgi:hypothetical protein
MSVNTHDISIIEKMLEDSYTMGFITSRQYKILSLAIQDEGCKVKFNSIHGKEAHYVDWTISIEYIVK